MDTFQCFQNGERIPCEEICNDSALRFFFYLFGILTLVFIFLVLMRPIVDYFVKKCVHQRRNNVVENSSVTGTQETQGTQCDLEIGMQRVVINPDDTLQLTDVE